jgi:hypothetical protein
MSPAAPTIQPLAGAPFFAIASMTRPASAAVAANHSPSRPAQTSGPVTPAPSAPKQPRGASNVTGWPAAASEAASESTAGSVSVGESTNSTCACRARPAAAGTLMVRTAKPSGARKRSKRAPRPATNAFSEASTGSRTAPTLEMRRSSV